MEVKDLKMTESDYVKLNDYLTWLSINGDTHGVAYAALRLQVELEDAEELYDLWGERAHG